MGAKKIDYFEDFNFITKVDFNNIPTLNNYPTHVWGTIHPYALGKYVLNNFSHIYKDIDLLSDDVKKSISRAIILSFDYVNKDGETNSPLFKSVLSQILLLIDPKNSYDIEFKKSLYSIMVKKFNFFN